ncbi:MAG: hypothetical protein ACLBM1_01400 [Cuspidothrix sp.]
MIAVCKVGLLPTIANACPTTCVACIAAPPTACAVAAIAAKYRFLLLRFNIFKFHTKQKSVIHHKYQLNNVVINQLSINTTILIFLPSVVSCLNN